MSQLIPFVLASGLFVFFAPDLFILDAFTLGEV